MAPECDPFARKPSVAAPQGVRQHPLTYLTFLPPDFEINSNQDSVPVGCRQLAAAGLVPALRSYGAEPERWRPREKDWNQDLQDLGLDGLCRMIAGESVSPLVPAVIEVTVDQSLATLSDLMPIVPEPQVEATAEAYPGAQPVEQTERAESATEDPRDLARLYRGTVDDEYQEDTSNRSHAATGWSVRQSRAPPR